MLEKDIEKHLNRKVKEAGGMCLKFTSSIGGIPDRVIIHKGRVYFIELKRDEGVLKPLQIAIQEQMKACEAMVFVLWNKGDVDWFVSEYL
jgi:hypothetical protein